MLGYKGRSQNSQLYYTIGNPTRDRIIAGNRIVEALGGTVTYAAILLRRFGQSVAVVGKGDSSIKAFYDASGIDTIFFRDGHPAVTFQNRYEGDDRWQSATTGTFISAEDVPQTVYSAPAILIGPVINEVDTAILHQHRSGVLMADLQGFLRRVTANGHVYHRFNEQIMRIIRHCDIIKADQREAQLITHAADASTAAQLLKTMGPQIVIVTRGKLGAVICDSHQVLNIKAHSVDSVDPTGAGDVFAAAFLVEYLRSHDTLKAGNVAACAAALTTRAFGTQSIPTMNDVKRAITAQADEWV